jgi:RNA polymerase sigma-70 factor, ECF subfamily
MGSPSVRELIDSHYASLYRYAFRLSGSAADAEDLTQETFGKALTRISQLRDADRAKPWLFRILRNEYLHRKRDERRAKVVPLEAVGDQADPPPDVGLGVDAQELQAALAELDETFRTPLILFYFEDFSYRDIADQMDLPIGTVMSRLARAKAYLRAKLFRPESHANGRRPTEGD